MQPLYVYFQATFSWTIAIPPDNNSNESSNNTEVDTANVTDKRTQLYNISSEEFAQFKFHFKSDYIPPSAMHINDSDEEELCHSERKLIYPHRAMSKDSEWLTIVQLAVRKQGVVVEQCVGSDQKCKFDDVFPLGVTSSCVQRFTYRPMVALVNGELKEELIKLPSSCKCVLKHRNKM